jgi:hypothetical protein
MNEIETPAEPDAKAGDATTGDWTGEAGAAPRPVTDVAMFGAAPVAPPTPSPAAPVLPGDGPNIEASPPPVTTASPASGRPESNAEIVGYAELRDACWRAHERRQTIIAVLGLPASGKTFFVQRLRQSLSQTHVYSAFRGLPLNWTDRIDRTREILLSSLRPTVKLDSRGAIHLFDVPGDFIAPLVRGGFRREADAYERLNAILLVLSLADAVVFVAPALQVLNRRLYIQEGDDEALMATATLDAAQRADRVNDLERFITSLQYLRGLLQPLRETLAAAERRARRRPLLRRKTQASAPPAAPAGLPEDPKAVLDRAIASALSTPFEQRDSKIDKPVRLPLLMLLSRADELKRRGGPAVTDAFDLDPAWQVVQCHSEYFDHLGGFESYCVDFLTAQRGENPERVIDKQVEGFGADGLLRGWLARAIADGRRPAWMNALRSPRTATRLRRWLDPQFPGIRR